MKKMSFPHVLSGLPAYWRDRNDYLGLVIPEFICRESIL
jgi:hypothetical protein